MSARTSVATAVSQALPPRIDSWAAVEPARVALLGTGRVGCAVLARLARLSGDSNQPAFRLVHVANSRVALQSKSGLDPASTSSRARTALAGSSHASRLDDVDRALQGSGQRIVIDATASATVADLHARWLRRGIHVVTACKLARGTSLARWQEVEQAQGDSSATYGDAATVGAGLPVLRAIRDLRAGGDRIHAIAGLLSGSLTWLFDRYDGVRPFSALVRDARDAGFTEPDPRDDLSGEDVRRKLLILARAAGVLLDPHAIASQSLVPDALRSCEVAGVDTALRHLDAPLRERLAEARQVGNVLRFVARIDSHGARVGLESLSPDQAMSGGTGTDNRVAIWSDRYADQPLIIQGPGAGADVTAAALIDDALRAARSRG